MKRRHILQIAEGLVGTDGIFLKFIKFCYARGVEDGRKHEAKTAEELYGEFLEEEGSDTVEL